MIEVKIEVKTEVKTEVQTEAQTEAEIEARIAALARRAMTPRPPGLAALATLALALLLAGAGPGCHRGSQTSGATTADPSTPTPAAPALPAAELACATDADCALVRRQLEGDEACCQRCNPATAGRADWVRRVDEACTARPDWMARCAPLACPVGVERAACRAGRCTIEP